MFYIFRKNNGRTETVESKDVDASLAKQVCQKSNDTLHGPFGSVDEGMEGVILYERWLARKRKK